MYITKKHISRRTVIRGLGVAISLPLLDAMVPALANVQEKTQTRPKLRFGATYVPNGALPELWRPKEVGRNFSFSDPIKSLEPFRDQVLVVTGLTGSGNPAPHLGCSCGWLNGVGAIGKDGAPIESGKTFDQFLVDKIADNTPLPSLQLGNEDMGTSVGACDGYACVYFNSLSWRTNTHSLPVQINPRLTFESMYGDTGATQEARLTNMRYKESILDTIGEETNALFGRVGPADRRMVNDYLDNVRQVEQRLQRLIARSQTTQSKVPNAPIGIPESFAEHEELNYDLMHLAFQGDITRVFTYLTAVEASNQNYPWIGVPESHHFCSHHGGIPELKAKYTKIVTWHVEQLARFAQKLKNTPDGDGSLLDHTLLYFGGGMGNGNVHDRYSPPMVAVGGALGRMPGNLHAAANKGDMQCDFLLNLAEITNVELARIGPSNGKLSLA